MFLDEELDQVLKHSISSQEERTSFPVNLLKCMVKRLPHPNQVPYQDCITEIKRIDNSWKLFCKKHPDVPFSKEFWRNWVLRNDKDDKLKKLLGW